MAAEHFQHSRESLIATDPEKLASLSVQQLERHHGKLVKNLPFILDAGWGQQFRDRIELLRSEIVLRKIQKQAHSHHLKSCRIERQTRFWAVIGGVTGMLILTAVCIPMIHKTFFAKVYSPASAIVSPEPAASSTPSSQSTTATMSSATEQSR